MRHAMRTILTEGPANTTAPARYTHTTAGIAITTSRQPPSWQMPGTCQEGATSRPLPQKLICRPAFRLRPGKGALPTAVCVRMELAE